MKTKFYLSLIGLWLFSNYQINAQTVTINDADFKAHIISQVDAAGGGNDDGEIQTSEALNLTQLFYQNETLTDATGLEAFTNLTDLYLNNTTLGTTIDVSALTKLENLDVTNTGISSLDVSTLSDLVSLSLSNNASLQSVDVSGLSLLRIFQANNSGLTSLDLSNNSAMEQLRVIGNDLETLNLRNGNNATLTTMRATSNSQLTCITVDDPTAAAGYEEWAIDATAEYKVSCTAPFVTTWQTTTASESITVPTTGAGYDYIIDWGDGTIESDQTGDATHTYATADTYTIKIYGDFPRIYFSGASDQQKILTIEQWGDIAWTSMEGAFDGCRKLTYNATDIPDLSVVESTMHMFRNCLLFNGAIGNWDVSNVEVMNGMFYNADEFNQPLNSWDVSNVTQMSGLFDRAQKFNQSLNNWDVRNVMYMSAMFRFANQFNQDIGDWQTESLISLNSTFLRAEAFNQDLSNWDVSGVDDMDYAFNFASAFDQNLGSWDVSAVTSMAFMFDNAGLSADNYTNTLEGWASLEGLQSNVDLGADGMEYCAAYSGRATLVDTHSWNIENDAPGDCPFDPETMVQINDTGLKEYLLTLVDAANGGNEDGQVQFDEAENYDGIVSYRNKSLSDITGLEYFTNITQLDLGQNEIDEFDPAIYTDLQALNLNGNNLTVIDVSSNEPLTSLKLADNNISSIDLSVNTGLEILYLQNNAFDAIDISANINLTVFALFDNVDLTVLDVSNNTAIRELELYNTAVSILDVSMLSDLYYLDISHTDISCLDLSNNGLLEYINAEDGSLAYLNLKNGNNELLEDLYLTNNADLTCVEVDDVTFAETNWTDIDEGLTFGSECREDQTISFDAISDKTFSSDPFALSATSDAGLDLEFSIVSGPATLDGEMVTISGVGTVVIAANQAGNASYKAAEEVTQTFEVSKADQEITITAIEDKESTDGAFDVEAEVDSGLELTYTIDGPATLDGVTVDLTGEDGTVTITIAQEGNENYNAASAQISFEVTTTITVTEVGKQGLSFTIYPNPASDWLHITEWSDIDTRVQFISLQGKVVSDRPLHGSTISTQDLQDGIYFVRLISNNNSAISKVLIQR